MHSKERLLKNSRLYLILDRDVADYDRLLYVVKESFKSGVDIVQLRDKNGLAKDILSFSQKVLKILKRKVPFIMNDRIDCALAIGADGVHLGQEDIPLAVAKTLMPKKAIIGISCQSLQHARQAQEQGADYIGFGSVFETPTKPDRKAMDLNLFSDILDKIHIPIFAIGGINQRSILSVLKKGIRRVAVCRAICQARNIQSSVGLLRKHLDALK